MSEDIKLVKLVSCDRLGGFTFSNITNASIKIPFKHHAYFSITIAFPVFLSHRLLLYLSLPLSIFLSLSQRRHDDILGRAEQMMLQQKEGWRDGKTS